MNTIKEEIREKLTKLYLEYEDAISNGEFEKAIEISDKIHEHINDSKEE